MTERVARKIAKLMARAIDQEGTPEAAACMRKVDRLLGLHDLTLEDVQRMNSKTEFIEHRFEAPTAKWVRYIMGALSRLTGTMLARGSGEVVFVYGRRQDCEVLEMLARFVVKQALIAADEAGISARHDNLLQPPAVYERERIAFYNSFAAGVCEKVDRIMFDRSATDQESTALVLSIRDRVERWANQENDFSPPVREEMFYDPDHPGYERGKTVNLTPGLEGTKDEADKLA